MRPGARAHGFLRFSAGFEPKLDPSFGVNPEDRARGTRGHLVCDCAFEISRRAHAPCGVTDTKDNQIRTTLFGRETAGGLIACADLLDFRDGLLDSREGPWGR
jgi:hypothetical protein